MDKAGKSQTLFFTSSQSSEWMNSRAERVAIAGKHRKGQCHVRSLPCNPNLVRAWTGWLGRLPRRETTGVWVLQKDFVIKPTKEKRERDMQRGKTFLARRKIKQSSQFHLCRNQFLETTYKLQQSRRFLIHSQQVCNPTWGSLHSYAESMKMGPQSWSHPASILTPHAASV